MHIPRVVRFLGLCLLLTAAGCQRAPAVPPADADGAGGGAAFKALLRHTGSPGPDGSLAAVLVVEPWSLPTPDGAAQPDLVVTADGDQLLSWIVREPEGHALQFARQRDGRWSETRTIARGTDWFVNWADTPHLLATADGALWAHWLRKSAAATYAYDVALTRSADGGRSWSPPVLINDDGTPTEHGFVSLWPATADSLGIAWLDGREVGGVGCAPEGDPPVACAMTLRAARIDPALAREDEQRLDARVCDCCQTDVALTARGPLLVYRDRAENEVRDIAATRRAPDGWTPARPVHADGWTMPACPVNGPAVAAQGHNVVVAWYTAAPEPAPVAARATGAVDRVAGAAPEPGAAPPVPGREPAAMATSTETRAATPSVRLAHSADAGDHFSPPRMVDRGEGVQGRVAIALDAEAAWLLWVREDGEGQSLHLARFTPDLAEELQRIPVARLQGRGRGTGFPQLMLAAGAAHVVWTDVVAGQPRLQGARIRLAR